jgi:predicted DNA-binding transcriptional regulator
LTTSEPRVIPVGHEPPPLHQDQDRRPQRHQEAEKAKGKAGGRRAGERFATLNAFVDFTLAELPRNEIAVWLILYRDTKNGTARTSQADLGRRAGVSDRTVRRAIDRLRRRGLLKVTYRGGIGRGASTYRVRPLIPEK